jgi:hypothetical protein
VATDEQRKSEHLYREVNKRIREVAGTLPSDGTFEFLCECSQPGCSAKIELTERQWDALLDGGGSVLLAAEHAGAAEGRRIIAQDGSFVLVASD